MHFKTCCRLSFSTISELLTLLQLLCPSNNKLPKSIYTLRKFFEKFSAEKEIKEYCPSCHNQVNEKCANPACAHINEEPDCYIKVDMKNQMKTILSRKFKMKM